MGRHCRCRPLQEKRSLATHNADVGTWVSLPSPQGQMRLVIEGSLDNSTFPKACPWIVVSKTYATEPSTSYCCVRPPDRAAPLDRLIAVGQICRLPGVPDDNCLTEPAGRQKELERAPASGATVFRLPPSVSANWKRSQRGSCQSVTRMTSGLEIDGGLFATVLLDLVGDFLPFMETVEPGPGFRVDA
jgi:hypothetical protein